MKLRTLALGILFSGCVSWTVFVQQENQRLRLRVSELHSRLDELQAVEAENTRLKDLVARQQDSESNVDRLRQAARDVLRLRAEVTSLHNLRKENLELTERIEQLSNEAHMATQVAESWRNFRWPAGVGTSSNAIGEFVLRAEPGTVPGDQLRGTESGNVPGSAPPGGQLLPAFAPVPVSPPTLAQPNLELPPDHAKMSNLDCASCHAGMVNPQGTTTRDLLKTARLFSHGLSGSALD